MKYQNTLTISFIICSLLLLTTLLTSFVSKDHEESGKVTIILSNVKTEKGSIVLALYEDQAAFKNEKPYKIITISKRNYSNQQVKAEIELLKGTYGIAMLDDENGNTKMDYSFGLPKEGFGFSNYSHKGWSHPNFNNFDFYHNGQHSTVKINVQYW